MLHFSMLIRCFKGRNIDLSCSTVLLTEKIIFDCLSISSVLGIPPGATLNDFFCFLFSSNLCFSPLLSSPNMAGEGTTKFGSKLKGRVG